MKKHTSGRNKISRRVSLILGIAVTSIFLITSVIFIGMQVYSVNSQLNQKLDANIRLAKTSLVSIIWHLNIPAINNVLAAIIADKNIIYVSLKVDGEVISKRTSAGFSLKNYKDFQNQSKYLTRLTEIHYLGTKIGTFQIVLTRESLEKKLFRDIVIILLVTVFAGVTIFFLTLTITKKSFLHPLTKLEQSAMLIATGKVDAANITDLKLIETDDEIGVLSLAFNKMIEQLKNNIDTLDVKVKERTTALVAAKEKAEKAAHSKTEFLTTMSHEIRTPLNSICGMSELLNETSLSERQQIYVKTLNSSSRLLLSIINDILDYSKIESEQVKLEQTPFSMVELLDNINSMFAIKAQSKNLDFLKWLDPEVKVYRIGDYTRIHQILINLISNAIKFTHSGEVSLEIINHPDKSRSQWIQCSVSDTGIGIPEDKLVEIFDHFSQADMSTTKEYGGTGLGLAISKKLITMMSGAIEVKSVPGKGTTFTFDIKIPEASAEDIELLTETKSDNRVTKMMVIDEKKLDSSSVSEVSMNNGNGQIHNLRILLAEDIQNNQDLIKYYMEDMPVELDIVSDGAEAYKKYQQNSYDLVLMDIQMPVMDGYQATELIRKWEIKNKLFPKPIIAITAHAFKQQKDKCLASGCDDFLPKPIQKKELLLKIESLLSKSID